MIGDYSRLVDRVTLLDFWPLHVFISRLMLPGGPDEITLAKLKVPINHKQKQYRVAELLKCSFTFRTA